MDRRSFLKQGLTVSAGLALGGLPKFAGLARAQEAKWRTFEIITRIQVADSVGAARTWVPVPLMSNTNYFKREPDTWSGNYKAVRQVAVDNVGTGVVFAEWPASEKSPTLEVKSRFATQDRSVDLSQKPNPAIKENKAVLDYFRKPSKYIRTDGIVATTSKQIVSGYKNDVEKARAIYDGSDNTFRDPKSRGCGIGDIKTHARDRRPRRQVRRPQRALRRPGARAGIPARDVYGVRVANSASYKSLGGRRHHRSAALPGRGLFDRLRLGAGRSGRRAQGGARRESPGAQLALDDPQVKRAREKLFGQWEMNWCPIIIHTM